MTHALAPHAAARRRCLRLAFGTAALAALAPRAAALLQWRERVALGFGTTLWLRAAHADAARVDAALDAALREVRHLHAQLSLFDAGGALARLNRDGRLPDPHPDLLAALRLARDVASRSGGAFDATVQPMWLAWDAARRAGRRLSDDELQAVRARVDWRGVEATRECVRLAHPAMALTLNGIAQGIAADRARDTLRAHGIAHALVDTGEWAALGRAPEGGAWTLGVANPRRADAIVARLRCDDGRALATSSDAEYAFVDDHSEHHILDPRTGHSPGDIASVTVVAPSCALADALTKVVFMAGWRDALAAAHHFGADALVVDKGGRWKASPGIGLAVT